MQNKWLPAAFLMTAAGWGANQFSPLLGAYQRDLGLSANATTGLLALYVVGLLPGLLLGGPLADRRGRRPVVLVAVAVNAVATVALMLGVDVPVWLAVGRLLTGLSTGAVLAAGSAWVRELSHPPFGTAVEDGAGARRAGVMLSMGFSISGLVSALIAQWGPYPLVIAYLPHLLLSVAGVVLALSCPETRSAGSDSGARGGGVRDPRFRRLVLPVAPWVFVGPTVAFGTLPGLVTSDLPGFETVYAGVTALITPGLGAVVQPIARRVAQRGERVPAVVGLVVLAAGLALAAVSVVWVLPWWALVACLLMGTGYGFSVTFCLTVVGRIAGPAGLARLTAVFWCIAYLGFCTPFAISLLAPVASAPLLLLVLVGLALITTVAVSAGDEPDRDGQERRRADHIQRLRDSGVL
ncbi:Nitrate/nitrite transporter NarK [Saccharopolyspora antimicrobica]|uniref:Nitrate/nitrite transporter NarK n=1 Tax=Saccharopolyspora antimicrobica TaxID=455193 RepID=A0A1I4SYK9_9PSEU|nr:MFS transporter [Saccharopolyspora antimicrobica]RKT85948.1 nitrate/nitrite transporter NarK [Saccharopolyspora antimicrobica]SFM69566.1 Nitrate/nitrite transporter NarK [Saccharopolyspora antimicrobica]